MIAHRTHDIRRRPGRRGTVYIAVLGISLLVVIIGLSTLLAVRVERRAASATEAAVQARLGAESVTDLALCWITADSNWRSTYTSGTWAAAQTVDGTTFSLKLVDELDGNLANDPTQPVRLYGKAVAGEAARISSLQLTPRPVVNLLPNADMEAGTTNWNSWNCSLTVRTSEQHGGAKCLLIAPRYSSDAEAYQLVTSTIQSGKTYNVELWAKMNAGGGLGTDRVTISLKITTTTGVQLFITASTTVSTTWTKVSGTLTPTWTGTLTEARWRTFTYPSGGTSQYFIDDAVWSERDTRPPLIPVPGTWRQDVLP